MFKKDYLLKLMCLLQQTDLRHAVLCVLPSGFFYLYSTAFFSELGTSFCQLGDTLLSSQSFSFCNILFPSADTLHTSLGLIFSFFLFSRHFFDLTVDEVGLI